MSDKMNVRRINGLEKVSRISSSDQIDFTFHNMPEFEHVLEQQQDESNNSDALIEAKRAIERGDPMTHFEVARLAEIFYQYGINNIKSRSVYNDNNVKAVIFALSAIFGLIYNYGHEDSVSDLIDYWELLPDHSPLLIVLQSRLRDLLKTERMPFKGICNAASGINVAFTHITMKIKSRLYERINKIVDTTRRTRLLKIFKSVISEFNYPDGANKQNWSYPLSGLQQRGDRDIRYRFY
ncbi:MAG: hypothetical protein GY730_03675 [bacterium]|nr:hypothetical protein [bacterium]